MFLILHTEVIGNGDPIVFLHTGLQTGSIDFEAQREYFKEKFQVILPDLRGHGNSVSDDFANYFYDSATDIKETLDDLDIESVHIVGCSLGALTGLIFAKRYPDCVKSLTLSGVIAEKPDNWEELNAKEVKNQSTILRSDKVVKHFDSIHKSDWKGLLKVTQENDWYPFEETDDLSMFEMPVLFIVGEGNTYETLGAIRYPKMNKNVHVSIVPFASHLVHLEQPDIYTKIVEEFLQKVDKVGDRSL